MGGPATGRPFLLCSDAALPTNVTRRTLCPIGRADRLRFAGSPGRPRPIAFSDARGSDQCWLICSSSSAASSIAGAALSSTEYAVVAALISVAAIIAMRTIGRSSRTSWHRRQRLQLMQRAIAAARRLLALRTRRGAGRIYLAHAADGRRRDRHAGACERRRQASAQRQHHFFGLTVAPARRRNVRRSGRPWLRSRQSGRTAPPA